MDKKIKFWVGVSIACIISFMALTYAYSSIDELFTNPILNSVRSSPNITAHNYDISKKDLSIDVYAKDGMTIQEIYDTQEKVKKDNDNKDKKKNEYKKVIITIKNK